MDTPEKFSRKLITEDTINIFYQPLISLKSGDIYGYESVSKKSADSEFDSFVTLVKWAKKHKLLLDLEKLIIKKTLQLCTTQHSENKSHLFIHIEPQSLTSIIKKESKLISLLKNRNIVFEITERHSSEDVKKYEKITQKCKDNRIKIATGNYASETYSLSNIKLFKPDFIKIDITLVRNVHTNIFQKSAIISICKLAEILGIKTIAKGVETKEELHTLIDIGVDYAQGFYIGTPKTNMQPLDKNRSREIQQLLFSNNSENNLDINIAPISNVVQKIEHVTQDIQCHTVSQIFAENTYEGLCVVDELKRPIGLIMKNVLSAQLGTQYGYSIYSNRNIDQVLDFHPIIVDCNTPITKVSEMVTLRSDNKVYDNIIVTKNDKYMGIVSIKDLLMHITSIEKNYAKHLNPLTMLPGNQLITYHIKKSINEKTDCAIFYADLDNFKIYNDVYGFDHGDKIIKLTAMCIEKQVKAYTGSKNFIGHIGGDDFVFIIYDCIEKSQGICLNILSDFGAEVKQFFNAFDLRNNYIKGVNRDGEAKYFDLTTLSIAGFIGEPSKFEQVEEFGKYIGSVKKEAKALKGNSYMLHHPQDDKDISYSNIENS